jgi:selenium-binding protein 1
MLESLRPDPTFYPSPRLAMEGEGERFTYTALLSPDRSRPDALAVVDVDRSSKTFGKVLHRLDMPSAGDEFHHFGWNACSSALSPMSGHPSLKRRYLIVPGIRSSRLYIVDTQPDPRRPRIAKIIEPDEVTRRTGYSRPHTVHCGPEGIYVSTLGGAGPDGTEGVPGVFILDCESFEILGKWEIDRGPQKLHYDFWWNLPRDYMVSSEWGLPPQFENGIVPEDLLGNRYGHALHFWDLRARKHVQTIDLGANHQMALEVRPAHDPAREYGFVGVVVDTTNLEASIWTWYRESNTKHPNGRPFGGGPQMTEISRDGKRVYFTNSLYSTWDTQFYPEGIPGVQAMCHVEANGGLTLDRDFCVEFGPEYGAHQVRLEGGDCSTDSFCYSSA